MGSFDIQNKINKYEPNLISGAGSSYNFKKKNKERTISQMIDVLENQLEHQPSLV